MKKVVNLLMVLSVLFTSSFTCYADENSEIKLDKSKNLYFEESIYKGDEAWAQLKNEKERKVAIDTLKSSNMKLVGVKKRKYPVKRERNELGEVVGVRPFTVQEYKMLDRKNRPILKDVHIGDDASQKEEYAEISLIVFKDESDNSYSCTGTVNWELVIGTHTTPDFGDDFIGFVWGGENKLRLRKAKNGTRLINGVYRNGHDISFTQAIRRGYEAIIWSFKDYIPISYLMDEATATIVLDRVNSYKTDETDVAFMYLHTYVKHNASIELSFDSKKAASASLILRNVEEQWPMMADVTGLIY